jgi:uncharacterized lipoprotein YddW (UPF0748 family)
MRRWRWKPLTVLLFWVSLALTLVLSQPTAAMVGPTSQEIRGVWITTNDTDILIDRPKLQDAIHDLAGLNLNTLYPVVWNAGYALYPSATAKRAGIQPFVRRGLQDYDILAEVATQGHRQGMMVIPWFEFGFMAPPTSELAVNHPDWLTQQRNGNREWDGAAGGVVWLNPFHAEVQQFIFNLVAEIFNQYDVDGIQFDDHFSLPVSFGYDPYTLALYKQETDKEAPADPHNPDWVRWRADKLTAFMQRLHDYVKSRQPQAVVSVAPNPYSYAYQGQLQDWLTWVRRDLVDELIVQVYRNDLQSFREQLSQPELLEAQQKIPTGVGILTGLRNSPVPMSFIERKVYSARGRNLGVAFFFYESLWEYAPEPAEERKASFQALFPERFDRIARL